MQSNKQLLGPIITGFVILIVGVLGYEFAVSDRLAGFSDDSATYLIMADVFSPYSNTPENFIRSYQNHYLPPGFAWVLAIFGGSSSIAISHSIVLSECLLTLIFCYLFFRNILGPLKAVYPLVLFVCIPGMWIQMLKIMSEHQYMAITIGFLYLIQYVIQKEVLKKEWFFAIGLILSFLILTRSIGISMAIAYFIWRSLSNRHKNCLNEFIITLVGILIPQILWFIIKPDIGHSYIDDIIAFQNSNSPFITLVETVYGNISALYNGWRTNLILIHQEGDIFREIIIGVAALLAIIGWMTRFKQLDALYVTFYIAILTIWPYPYEMDRFIYPVMPLLLLYILLCVKRMFEQFNPRIVLPATSFCIVLVLTGPALAHIVDRYKLGQEQYGENITNVIELYELPDISEAVTTALIWNKDQMFMESLSTYFREDDKVLTIKPHFFTYLSGVYAEMHGSGGDSSPDIGYEDLIAEIKKANFTHILLLNLTLIGNKSDINIFPELSKYTDVVLKHSYSINGQEQLYFAVLELR
jgi:hypothetical protein